MNPETILFFFLAVVSIASALAMLFTRNTIYSALFLILNFSTIAVFYLILNAPFIAMAQITVYAGAIMVLFLFVIMMLGSEQLHKETVNRWQRPLAILLGLVLLGEAAYLIILRGGRLPMVGSAPENFGNPASIGSLLFSQYLLPFEITSILLLVAMVGALVLTQSEKRHKSP
jgi:NADH-quinone oxidoreductase subunit J